MCTTREMPKFQSIKQAWALQIKELIILPDGSANFLPKEDGYGQIALSKEYIAKHDPKVGGYYVAYEEGSISFSPAEAFEKGNALIQDIVIPSYNTELSMKDVKKDYQKRVCVEYEGLFGKINSLLGYLENNVDTLLTIQLSHMFDYVAVLELRIRSFEV